jgi:hypothetical protein
MIKINNSIREVISYAFQTLLFLFLLTLLVQQFFPIEVNSRININWFMIAVIVIGAMSIIFPPDKEFRREKESNWKDYLLIIILGIVGGALIWIKLQSLGWISYVISVLGGLIILFLSWLIINEKEDSLD